MPEGHSIKYLADKFESLIGETLSYSSPQARFADGADQLTGLKLVTTDSHGKHLFLNFEQSVTVHIHLGLYGKFTWHRGKAAAGAKPRESVRFRMETDRVAVDLTGPTQCEVLDPAGVQRVHDRLGPDPLRPGDTIEALLPWLEKSAWPLGKTVLDQAKLAGIGNVYRAEILFLKNLNPWTATKDLDADAWREVWTLSRTLLEAGVRHGSRIFTTSNELPRPPGLTNELNRNPRTYVYGRADKPCLVCSTSIEKDELASRTIYWCPTCQGPKP